MYAMSTGPARNPAFAWFMAHMGQRYEKVESRNKIYFGYAETAASIPLAFSQNIDYIRNP